LPIAKTTEPNAVPHGRNHEQLHTFHVHIVIPKFAKIKMTIIIINTVPHIPIYFADAGINTSIPTRINTILML
jgi:hypothetical protein